MAFRISREHFEKLVGDALRGLPDEYVSYFRNITVIVEDYPTETQSRELNTEREHLLGLFSGIPYPLKGGFFDLPPPLPDTIILYQKNIEAICSTEAELVEETRKTLVHEVGHFFGLSERDLRKYE